MKYDIFELHRTGMRHQDEHGKIVEQATSEFKARITAKSKASALTEYLKTLPFGDKCKIFNDLATGDDGLTTKCFCRKAVTTYTKQGDLI